MTTSTGGRSKFLAYVISRIINQKMQLLMNVIFMVFSFIQFGFLYQTSSEIRDISMMVFALSLIGFAIMTYAIGISSFNHLHDKNLTDMVYSLPISRKMRYWGDYLSGLAITTIPFISSFILAFPILLMNIDNAHDFEAVCKIGIFGVLIMLMLYSMTVFATSLCGRIFESISVPLMYGILVPAMMYLLIMITYGNTYGLWYDLAQFSTPLFISSPFTMAMWLQQYIEGWFDDQMTWEPLFAFLMSVLFIIAAYFLNMRRKPEHTGRPFPVKMFYHVYITSITFCITAVCMYFIIQREFTYFRYYYEFDGLTSPILICFGVLATLCIYLLFDVINNKGLKKPPIVLLRWLVTTGGSVLICLGLFMSGGFGAVNHVPKLENVNGVIVSNYFVRGYEGDFIDYEVRRGVWGYEFKEKENIKHILEFHNRALEIRYDINNYYWIDTTSISYSINGSNPIERTYPLTEYTLEPLKKLFLSSEYIEAKLKSSHTLLQGDNPNITIQKKVETEYYYELIPIAEIYNTDMHNAIMEAYRMDMYAETEEQMFAEANMEYYYIIVKEFAPHVVEFGQEKYPQQNTIIVKPHYTNLIEYIESL